MFDVTCHMLPVACHLSPVTCHLSIEQIWWALNIGNAGHLQMKETVVVKVKAFR